MRLPQAEAAGAPQVLVVSLRVADRQGFPRRLQQHLLEPLLAPRQVLPVGLVFLPLVGEGVVLPPVPVQEVLQLVPVRVLLFKPREKVQKPKIAKV